MVALAEVEHVHLSYAPPDGGHASLPALQDVSLRVAEGEFVSLIGPSGCGKTTLLRLIAGLVPRQDGVVRVGSRDVNGPSSIASFVFQQIALVPWRTAIGNVELVLELKHHRRLRPAERARAREILRVLGLAGYEAYYPWQLSGGMQQRVGIARALSTEPRLLLMDEPFGALDAQTRRILQDELLSICARQHLAVLFVTHDLDEAIYLSDRVVVLSARPGQVIDDLAVDLPSPRMEYDVRAHPRYGAMHAHLWELLRVQNERLSERALVR